MLWWKNASRKRYGEQLVQWAGLLLAGGLLLTLPSYAQTPSVLGSGTWVKLAVTESGVYRLTAGKLREMGLNVATLNPKNLQVFGQGGGMLPQQNARARPVDLVQNALWVQGEEDGRFDASDALYFYAEGPHVVRFDSLTRSFSHQINLYSDSTYYYLTVGTQPGLRVQDVPSQSVEGTLVDQFDDYWFHEQETVNLLQSGREWWGEYLGLSAQLRLQADLPGVVPGTRAVLRGAGIASAQVPTRLRWQVNGVPVGEQTQGAVSTYRYDLRAQRSEGTYPLTIGSTPPASFEITVTFDKNNQNTAQAYLDYAALQVRRSLRAYAKQPLYRFLPLPDSAVTYVLREVPTDWQWWDLSSRYQPRRAQLTRSADGSTRFSAGDGERLRTYAGFSPSQALEPVAWQKVPNQNLHGLSTPDLLIISPTAWYAQAVRLAQFRQAHDGLSVEVVTTGQIFNEFSAGKPDPTAIRDFVRSLYQKKAERLKYLLLFGDATYDARNHARVQSAAQHENTVPVYESRESLHPVFTYSSDDYFGFMDETEGEWNETLSGDHLLDIGVGRLPVKSVEEARIVVDKLIHYGSSPQTLGKWRNRINFVADDGDGQVHQQHADALAHQIEEDFLTQRLFVAAFPRIALPEGSKTPALNAAIRQRIDDGTLILNYTGHGGTTGWAEEQILTLPDMLAVRGYDNLPLLLTATCEFGRYDDPTLVSGAELMVLSPRGAAIGALTTTRPVFSSTNFSLNTAFYKALSLGKPGDRLGDLMKYTKNNSLSGSLNRNFALLGDPSMKLARAKQTIDWEVLPDTLSAQRKVTLRGQVNRLGEARVDPSFSGVASVTVYDKPVQFSTGEASGSTADYQQMSTKLFEGNVTVKNGSFSATFVVPRNIDYTVGKGRVSMYAVRSDSLADAAGQLAVWVGGTAPAAPDRTLPQLVGYLNDSTFQDGQTVPPSSVLWVELADENGINVSSAGLGQNLTATLDDTVTYVLNDYFQASLDTYQRGTIRFPLPALPPGSHTLRIKVWDTYTNSSELTLRFKVLVENNIELLSSILFPNPFRDRISFKITHNRPREDVELTFRLITLSGQIVQTFRKVYYTSETVITESLEMNPNTLFAMPDYLPYLYDIQIRSMKDQTVYRRSGKLLHKP